MTMKLRVRFPWLSVAMCVALGLAAVRARPADRFHTQTTTLATLQDLGGVDEIKTRFNRDTGKIRLVLLLSPT
ncbi:MAG: hypothetical protein ACRD1S_00125 [Vicinamibacterales bacterium]